MSTANRIARLRDALGPTQLDAFFVSQPENRRYMSGFTGSAGWLLVSKGLAILATDSRYTEQAESQAPDFQIVQIAGTVGTWLPPLLEEFGEEVTRVGFESEHVTHGSYGRLAPVFSDAGKEMVSWENLVEDLRVFKDDAEKEALLKAIRVTDEAFEEVRESLQPGQTEREVALKIEWAFRERGAEGEAFESIVASGPNGAMAHHRPSDDILREGQPIVIDIGAKVDGYNADMTRTVILGEPDDTFKRIYDIVLTAQETAIATIESGITGDDADALARNIIEHAGHGEEFGHALGHGVGLAVHEGPRVGRGASDVLREGMVFTIEPGIYISGWGGVRIEDVVELRDGKCIMLSSATKWGG
ncbi:MAG: aminopeptidase P family protein [Dehalococcoidia bacterium]|nr:aminopeptidase P family protein [Dehalococcoidia bacterium]